LLRALKSNRKEVVRMPIPEITAIERPESILVEEVPGQIMRETAPPYLKVLKVSSAADVYIVSRGEIVGVRYPSRGAEAWQKKPEVLIRERGVRYVTLPVRYVAMLSFALGLVNFFALGFLYQLVGGFSVLHWSTLLYGMFGSVGLVVVVLTMVRESLGP